MKLLKIILILIIIGSVVLISSCTVSKSSSDITESSNNMIKPLNENDVNNNKLFVYDTNTKYERSDFSFSIFGVMKISEIPCVILRKNSNYYYTILSIKNRELCYIIFKEQSGELFAKDIWIYSKSLISKDSFGVLKIGSSKYSDIVKIDKETVLIGDINSATYSLSFFNNGTTSLVTLNDNWIINQIDNYKFNIYKIIFTEDYPSKILN